MALNSWLNKIHTAAPPKMTPEEAAVRAENALVIDNFLHLEVLQKLRLFFEKDVVWKDSYGIGSGVETVTSLAEYEAARPNEKLYHFLSCDIQPVAGPMTPGWIAWVFLSKFFGSNEFLRFVADASGVAPTHFQGYACHTMLRGHHINAHSDRGKNRVLCGVLYVGSGWQTDFGAEFEILRDGITTDLVEPLANRLVLFRPQSASVHRVRPITAAAKDWARRSITLWWADNSTVLR
jgi:hypothetical protein